MYSVARYQEGSIMICLFLESNGALRVIPPALFHDNRITGFAGVILSLVGESTLTPNCLENPVHFPHSMPVSIPPFPLVSSPLHCSEGRGCFVPVVFGGG
jgi:hypothetical protein